MIIGAPDQRATTWLCWTVGCRLLRPVAPAKKIAVADGVVPSKAGFAFPPEFEDAFGDAALIARIRVDRPPTLSPPTDDLDREALRRIDEASISLEVIIARRYERYLVDAPHASCRHISDLRRIKIHDGLHSARSESPDHKHRARPRASSRTGSGAE